MPQPDPLRQATDDRVRSSRLAVEAAIRTLAESGESLSVANVARKAGVSMTYIHNHPALKDEIVRLRAERGKVPRSRRRKPQELSTPSAPPPPSLEDENRLLRLKVAELEDRVQALRAVLWGDVKHS